MIRNIGQKIQILQKDLKKLELKEEKVGIGSIEKTGAAEETKEPSLLNDPLFIKGYLESYRDELYYLNCPSDAHELIMNTLERELRNYYKENGEAGLKEHLDKVFEKLKKTYLGETNKTDETDDAKNNTEDKSYTDSYSNGDSAIDVSYDTDGKLKHIVIKDADGNVLIDADIDDVSLGLQLANVDDNIKQAVKGYQAIAKAQENVDRLREKGDSELADKMQAELDNQKEAIANALTTILDNSAKEKELNNKLFDLQVPTPPNPSDYTNKAGELDKEAYEHAIHEYEHAKDEYDNAQIEISRQLNNLKLDSRRAELLLDITESVSASIGNEADVLADLKEQITSTNDPELKAQLEENYEKLKENFKGRLSINEQIGKIYEEQANMKIPTPPSPQDYMITSYKGQSPDGTRIEIKQDENGNWYAEKDVRGLVLNNSGEMNKNLLSAMSVKDAMQQFGEDPRFNDAIAALQHSFPDMPLDNFYVIPAGNGEFRFCLKEEFDNSQNSVSIYSVNNGVYKENIGNVELQKDANGNVTGAKLSDGTIINVYEWHELDPIAYQKAQADYTRAKNEYDAKQDSLNKNTMLLNRLDSQLYYQAQNIISQNILIAEYSDALDHLKESIDNATDPEIKAALQEQYDNMKALYKEIMSTNDKISDIYEQRDSREVPTPPSPMDFITTDEKGINILDEVAYKSAIEEYEQKMEEYKKYLDETNAQLDSYKNVCKKNAELKNESINNTVRLIQEFAGALSRLQCEIDAASDPSIKAELQAKYNELQQLMKQAIELSKQADEALLEGYTSDEPLPPSPQDFMYTNENGENVLDEAAYMDAVAQYEKDIEAYEQKIAEQKAKADELNKQLAQLLDGAGINFEKGNSIELTAERQRLDAKGQRINQQRETISSRINDLYMQMNDLRIPTPPSPQDFMITNENGEKVLDEDAYKDALKQYQEAKNAYDNEINRLNQLVRAYQLEYNKLEMSLRATDADREQLMQYMDLLKSVAEKISGDLDADKTAQLKDIYNQINDLVHQDIELSMEIEKIREQMFNAPVPTPPNKLDFSYFDIDGNRIFDEPSYDSAMEQYDINKSIYDATQSQLNAQMKELSSKRIEIYENIKKLKAQADDIN